LQWKNELTSEPKKGAILTGQNGSPSQNRTIPGRNSVEQGRNGARQSVAPTRLWFSSALSLLRPLQWFLLCSDRVEVAKHVRFYDLTIFLLRLTTMLGTCVIYSVIFERDCLLGPMYIKLAEVLGSLYMTKFSIFCLRVIKIWTGLVFIYTETRGPCIFDNDQHPMVNKDDFIKLLLMLSLIVFLVCEKQKQQSFRNRL
jgi:hypothetical protein